MRRLVTGLAWLIAAPAAAQAPTVDPSGAPAAPTAPVPPPGGYAPGSTAPGPAPAAPPDAPADAPREDASPAEEQGLYLGPAPGQRRTGSRAAPGGPVPEVHVVERHDTLWDICETYFGDPWRWPEIWSYNPGITNPHWIFPGNVVRLAAPGVRRDAAGAPDGVASADAPAELAGDTTPRAGAIDLRQLAFVGADELAVAGEVAGSTEEKLMLSEGDEVYVDYAAQPPRPGSRLAIYAPTRAIVHPRTKKKVGSYVLLRGELQVLAGADGRRVRGRIVRVTGAGVIERGNRVGPLRTQLRVVKPRPAPKGLEAVIAGIIGTDHLAGEGQLVFLDRGRTGGLAVGHRLAVVRRGDAYPAQYGASTPAGMNDPAYPQHVLGEVIVVDVAEQTSVALMLRSDKELLVGDRLVTLPGP